MLNTNESTTTPNGSGLANDLEPIASNGNGFQTHVVSMAPMEVAEAELSAADSLDHGAASPSSNGDESKGLVDLPLEANLDHNVVNSTRSDDPVRNGQLKEVEANGDHPLPPHLVVSEDHPPVRQPAVFRPGFQLLEPCHPQISMVAAGEPAETPPQQQATECTEGEEPPANDSDPNWVSPAVALVPDASPTENGGHDFDLDESRKRVLDYPCEHLLPEELSSAQKVLRRGMPYTQSMMTIDALTLFSSLTKLGTRVNGNRITCFEVPTNLYVATVGDSGCLKSPKTQTNFYEPITGIEEQIEVRNEERHDAWLLACENTPRGVPKPKQPTRLQHHFQQYTSAGVDSLLTAHEPEQLATLGLIDEGIRFIKQVKATSGQEERLLELFDGKGNKTLLATGNRCYSRSHMSLHISIQGAVLGKLFSANPDDNGLWARFLYYPMLITPSRLPTDQSEEQLKQSQEARATLKRYAEKVFAEEPRTYFLDQDGVNLLSQYNYGCQHQLIKGDHPSLKAIKGKSTGKVLRVAGLLHIAWSVHAGSFQQTIPVQRLADAIELVELLDSYAAAMHLSVASSPGRGYDDTFLRRLHALSLKQGGMSWSEFRARLNSEEKKGVTAAMAEQCFRQLEQLGIGVVTKGPRGGLVYRAKREYPT